MTLVELLHIYCLQVSSTLCTYFYSAANIRHISVVATHLCIYRPLQLGWEAKYSNVHMTGQTDTF
jgi:hypothetical protein